MEYTNIIALVPQGEHFDAKAVNEGVWLSAAHLDNVETSLGRLEVALTDLTASAKAKNEAFDALQVQADASAATITERDAAITDLQQQIATLKAAPAASFSNTTKEGDDIGAEKTTFNHPVNAEANKLRVALGKQPI